MREAALRVAAPAPEPRAITPFSIPRFEPDRAESLFAAMQAVLRRYQVTVDYDDLVAISGAAFRLAWRSDGLYCPSVLHVYPHDPFVTVGEALGVDWRVTAGEAFTAGVETVRQQLERGRPVLTCGLLGHGDWSVIGGVSALDYRQSTWAGEPPIPFITVDARTADDPDERLTRVQVSNWSGYLPGPDAAKLWQPLPLAWVESLGAPPEWPVVVAASLRRITDMIGCRAGRGYVYGAAAYARWAARLRDEEELGATAEMELERQAWANAWIATRLCAARGSATRFLRRNVPQIENRQARGLLTLAARQWQDVGRMLEDLAALFPVRDDARRAAYLNPKVRAAAAQLLGRCSARERTAVGYLLRAVERLG